MFSFVTGGSKSAHNKGCQRVSFGFIIFSFKKRTKRHHKKCVSKYSEDLVPFPKNIPKNQNIFYEKNGLPYCVQGRKKYFIYSYRMCECVGLREITLPTAGEPYQTVPNHTIPVDLFWQCDIIYYIYTVQCTLYRHRGFSHKFSLPVSEPIFSRIPEVSYIGNSDSVQYIMRGGAEAKYHRHR